MNGKVGIMNVLVLAEGEGVGRVGILNWLVGVGGSNSGFGFGIRNRLACSKCCGVGAIVGMRN